MYLSVLCFVACSGIGVIYPPITNGNGHWHGGVANSAASLRCASIFNTANDTATVQSKSAHWCERASGRFYRLSPLAAIQSLKMLKMKMAHSVWAAHHFKKLNSESKYVWKNWSLSLALGEVVSLNCMHSNPLCRPMITSTRNPAESPAYSRGHSTVKAEMIDVIRCTRPLGNGIWFENIDAHHWKSYCWSTYR